MKLKFVYSYQKMLLSRITHFTIISMYDCKDYLLIPAINPLDGVVSALSAVVSAPFQAFYIILWIKGSVCSIDLGKAQKSFEKFTFF